MTRVRAELPTLAALLICASSGCTSSSRPPVAASAPVPVAAPAPPDPRDVATERFYEGKAYALAGDADCARLSLDESLEAFRLGARPGHPDDLQFAEQLYDSVRIYRGLVESPADCERPPAEDPRDSLLAEGPGASAEELAQVGREVAATAAVGPRFDIPVVVNEDVLRAIAFYQFRTPKNFAGALQRGGRYTGLMREILRKEGLPQDLVYVAMIESAFKSNAHSRAAAHGFWQFVAETGRRYGLKQTRYLDERSDPVKSTLAAAAYLRDLYEMFGDWHLAMAAYDTGEGRIIRALQRTGARDYWELSRSSSLHRETRDYVPFVLAAALISKDPVRFGFDVVPDAPILYDVVRVTKPLDLHRVAEVVGSTTEELEVLNTELKTRYTPRGTVAYELRVPPGKGRDLVSRLDTLPEAPELGEKRAKVKKGDTVARVAARYRVSVAELCDFNDLTRKSRLKPGATLVIPVQPARETLARKAAPSPATLVAEATPGSQESGIIRALPTPASAVSRDALEPVAAARAVDFLSRPKPAPAPLPSSVDIPREGFVTEAASNAARPSSPSKQQVVHVVRAGETLFGIARHYGINVDDVRKQNRIRRAGTLSVGQRLTLSLASIH